MASDLTKQTLARLDAVTRSGDGWSARCPAHDDRNASLSVAEGSDGRVLLKCHAGCAIERIVTALGLSVSDLFPTPADHPRQDARSVISVEALAKDKGLPPEFLRGLGLEDVDGGVKIPYRLQDGTLAPRHRLRTALQAKDGSYWLPKRGSSPVPYGLDRLDQARKQGYLVLVEGESDSWTLWQHGFPALGIPGASMTKILEAEHVDGIPLILIQQEPDQGGETFLNGVLKRLTKVGWRGHATVVHPEGGKDFNELHRINPDDFKSMFLRSLRSAKKLVEDQEAASRDEANVGDLLVAQLFGSLPQNPPSPRLDKALRELAAQLSGSDAVRRGVAREAAIRRLKRLGIGAPAKLLDGALGPITPRNTGVSGDIDLTVPEPERWPEAVDGAEVLNEIVGLLRAHLVLPKFAAEMIALWILHVHALDAWHVSPILVILSPTKRCGKTTLLIILTRLVPRSLAVANITSAAIYRSLDRDAVTLLIDEADSFLTRNEELRGVVNSGHCRETAFVLRCVGDDHEPKKFRTWGAKAIAAIGRIPSTLEDRGLVLHMQRKALGDAVTRLRLDRLAHLEAPKRKAIRWVEDHLEALRQADPPLPETLNDRAQDNWRSLVAIADIAGGDWPERAREAAVALSADSNEGDTTPNVLLLSDLREVFHSSETEHVSTETILHHLHDREDRPWREWRKGKPLSAVQLARLLRPFKIQPRTVRIGTATPKGYACADFEETFSRYLPPFDPQQPPQTSVFNELAPVSTRNTSPRVAGRDRGVSTDEQSDVAGVAAQIGGCHEDPDASDPETAGWEDIEV